MNDDAKADDGTVAVVKSGEGQVGGCDAKEEGAGKNSNSPQVDGGRRVTPPSEKTEKTERGERTLFDFEVEIWSEAVDGTVLLDELTGLMRRYVVLPEWGAEMLSLWILHTYAFE